MPATSELSRLLRRGRQIWEGKGLRGIAAASIDKSLVYASYPVRVRLLRNMGFRFRGAELPYFAHHYNATWRSERIVEIPLADQFMRTRQEQRGLEVGNVLSHYRPTSHRVLDKYERSADVLNVDVLDYRPDERWDFIISISTLEHVGWDEEPKDEGKTLRAVRHLRSLLAPDGRMFVTVPRGYHPGLDAAIRDRALDPIWEGFLTRPMDRNAWHEQTRGEALGATPYYDERRRNAHDLWVAEFGPSGG